MNTSTITSALSSDIAIALSATRWAKLYHLSSINALNNYGLGFLYEINDPFYLIQFVHSTMMTITGKDVIDCRQAFPTVGLQMYKEMFEDIFELDKEKNKSIVCLLDLVEKIYNYFTSEDTASDIQLKAAYLKLPSDTDLEIAEINFRDTYNNSSAREIYALMRILYNNDNTLQDIEGLTPEADWKHIILSHYNFEAIEYPLFEEVFPKIAEEVPETRQFDDDTFNKISEDELPEMKTDLFDKKYTSDWCNKLYLERTRKKATSKGGKVSKTNHITPITLQVIETGEILEFASIEDCAKHFNISTRTINNFKRGNTKLNKIYQIIGSPLEGGSPTSLG